ncbi:MAG: hydroxymethylbilane synthase [Selenomonadaceae bacterium]|nr:hydroxymethylbilane synthase [Selenomonadaceae bacterium]
MEYVRIGTRSSKLALWQANLIALALSTKYPEVKIELVHVTTKGDKVLDSPLSKIGGKGLFTKELELAMLEGKADLAVHSLKDVPVELPPEFTIAAVTKREVPFDAFVSNKYKSFAELPKGARVGTSSLRRRAQLLAIRSDLQIDNLRGNVDTRLKRLDDGDFDGIILAAAGLKRLGHERRITEILPTSLMLPAVGQGAIAIETLTNNTELVNMLRFLNDKNTEAATNAERAFLKVVEGGCQVPVGVFGKVEDNKITVAAVIASIDGQKIISDKLIGSVENSVTLGKTLANKLLDNGGREILSAVLS